MLVSLKWLREYLDPAPPSLLADPDGVAHRLTLASAEVEGIHRVGDWDRERVVIGEVLAIEAHPNADRLRLATVNYGGGEPQRVVCGAPNLAVGQRIAFGREGAVLIDGHNGERLELKRASIRGVESAGMVLSERELGLSEAHEGILELPADAPIGTPLAEYLGDVVLDVHVWPNRADTMNMLGIAREIAAIEGGAVREPDYTYKEGKERASEVVEVRIEDAALCPRYIATLVEGVTVGASPAWLQDRLRAAGQRPISNIVDITNYVMLELGQPLHAFDADQLRGAVVVRPARAGERITTLDGVDRELREGTLLITDEGAPGGRPIAIAGVMGGASTQVTDATTRVLLEAAAFDGSSIRRTSTRLHLRSEASARFERGLSPELPLHASKRATKLLVEVAGGTARRGRVDAYPRKFKPRPVEVTRKRLDTVIGYQVPDREVRSILDALGFQSTREGSGARASYIVTPPWWRTDIAIPDDVVEEVVRIAGYDRLASTGVAGRVPPREPRPLEDLRERLRDAFVRAGLQETMSYSLTTDAVLRRVIPTEDLAIIRPLRLRNTLSADREVMRPTLRHAILETVDRNIRGGAPSIAVFEASRVYLPRHNEGPDALPDERWHVVGALTGVEVDRWGRPAQRTLDFFDAKGALEGVADEIGIVLDYTAAQEFALLPGRTAHLALTANGKPERVGVLGEVHPDVLGEFGISQRVVLFELDVAALLPHLSRQRAITSVSRYPAVEQDLALVLDEGVPAGRVQRIIESSALVASARIFDEFKGDQLAEGKKSLAFSIRYQAADRTLTTDDANREQARLVRRLTHEVGAEQRA